MAKAKATKAKTKVEKTKVVKSKVEKVKETKVSKKAPKVNVKVKKEVAKKSTKIQAMAEKQTRLQILKHLAEKSDLTKVQIETVFDELVNLIEGHMKKRGSGEFTIPGTGIKIRRVKKKATKARKMVSPLTGEEVTIAAKPARQSIKVSALKVLKEMVNK